MVNRQPKVLVVVVTVVMLVVVVVVKSCKDVTSPKWSNHFLVTVEWAVVIRNLFSESSLVTYFPSQNQLKVISN